MKINGSPLFTNNNNIGWYFSTFFNFTVSQEFAAWNLINIYGLNNNNYPNFNHHFFLEDKFNEAVGEFGIFSERFLGKQIFQRKIYFVFLWYWRGYEDIIDGKYIGLT